MTISSWLNFGRPAPPGRGSAAGWKFLAQRYYGQHAVFASPLSAFHYCTVLYCILLYCTLYCAVLYCTVLYCTVLLLLLLWFLFTSSYSPWNHSMLGRSQDLQRRTLLVWLLWRSCRQSRHWWQQQCQPLHWSGTSWQRYVTDTSLYGEYKQLNIPMYVRIDIEPSELPQASMRPNSWGAQHTEFTVHQHNQSSSYHDTT